MLRILAVAFACLSLLTAGMAQRNPERATVGKLGQLTAKVPIYTKANKHSRILYYGKPQLYVVMRNLTDEWATIVMADGSSGYVEAKFVDALPYDVNVKKPTTRPTAYATRGGFDRSSGMAIVGDDLGSRIVRMGLQYLGTPYKWGGNSLTGGIDCSGFVKQLFSAHGISLPRTAQEQSGVGMPVDNMADLQVGDRLYFTDSDRLRVTHTGIYMGNGYFIHSSSGNGGIATDPLSEKWLRTLVAVRR
jgi:hypothetical protein